MCNFVEEYWTSGKKIRKIWVLLKLLCMKIRIIIRENIGNNWIDIDPSGAFALFYF